MTSGAAALIGTTRSLLAELEENASQLATMLVLEDDAQLVGAAAAVPSLVRRVLGALPSLRLRGGWDILLLGSHTAQQNLTSIRRIGADRAVPLAVPTPSGGGGGGSGGSGDSDRPRRRKRLEGQDEAPSMHIQYCLGLHYGMFAYVVNMRSVPKLLSLFPLSHQLDRAFGYAHRARRIRIWEVLPPLFGARPSRANESDIQQLPGDPRYAVRGKCRFCDPTP